LLEQEAVHRVYAQLIEEVSSAQGTAVITQ
jgi:hypothetical protein